MPIDIIYTNPPEKLQGKAAFISTRFSRLQLFVKFSHNITRQGHQTELAEGYHLLHGRRFRLYKLFKNILLRKYSSGDITDE